MKAFNELVPYQDDPIVRQIIWEILPAASKIEGITVDEFIDQNLTRHSQANHVRVKRNDPDSSPGSKQSGRK